MNIDISRVETELAQTREQIEKLKAHEQGLVAFIETAKRYAVSPPAKQKTSTARQKPWKHSKSARQPKQEKEEKEEIRRANRSPRFQPNKFPPQPIPETYHSPNRRTRLLKAIIDNFEPDSIITAQEIDQKIGSSWEFPAGVPRKHHFSAVLMHENGPAAILEKVAKGSWRIKPNGLELLQSRVAAEIAQAQDEAARRSVQ